jgi:hypothetical protein
VNKSDLADRYQLLHLVHQGYLGALWAARGHSGEAAGSPALVRRMQLPASLSEEQRSAITEAAWDSLELSHDCLLKVGEVVFTESEFAIAYDYVEAEVLQALLLMGTVKKTPLAPEVVARILLDVVEGLQVTFKETQDMDINPHGGVTPESILVGSDGRARLVDSVVGAVASTVPAIRVHANRVGYCSPEQLKGETIDERSEVFSLGILLAELLAGRRFLLGAASAIEQKIAEGKLPRVNGWLKPERGIDAKLLDVLDRAIAADRNQRPSSLQALADEVCASIAAPASRAQVGAAVYALAAKQLEVRGRKLGLSSGPRLSERVARGPRSSPRVQLPAAAPAQAALAAPRAVDASALEHEATTRPPAQGPAVAPLDVRTPKTPAVDVSEPKADSQRDTTVAPEHRGPQGTLPGLAPPPATMIGGNGSASKHQVDSQEIDNLLDGLEPPTEKRDDMQSGTHRKVLTTLIGVAPPPRPNIGGPPPLAIPTNVALVSAAKPATLAQEAATGATARDAAGIADLLRTAVPSRRPEANGARPVTEIIAPAGVAKLPALPREEARDPISVALSTEPPPESGQLERYRRLTIFFGATTVLLLTLLLWMVLDGAPVDRAPVERPNATKATATAVNPSSKRPAPEGPAAAASAGTAASAATIQPQVDDKSSEPAASASAESKKTTPASGKAVPRSPVAPRKPTKKKIFVPDDI